MHITNGYNNGAFRHIFDGLQTAGARWDMMGLSLYPNAATWPTHTAQTQANMNDLVSRYPGKQVMVVEAGMPAYLPIATREFLYDLIARTQAGPNGAGLGVLYWEPEAYNWQGYTLGAWGTDGHATGGMAGFLPPPTPPLVDNPGFEYSAATQTPLGWTTTSTTGDADADYTETGGHGSQFRLTHYKATAYQVRTWQTISNLPNGTYTLRAWVQNGDGQTTCQLYAQAGGAATTQNLTLPTVGTWTQTQIPGIVVANGQCEIGLRSVAAAGNYCSLDDVELVPNAALATTAASAAATPQLYPNPTAGSLTISYVLDQPAAVAVALYALTGQLVRPLATLPSAPAGPHRLTLGTLDGLPAGVYLVRLSHEGYTSTQRLVKL